MLKCTGGNRLSEKRLSLNYLFIFPLMRSDLVVAGAGLLCFSTAHGLSFRQLHGSVPEFSAVAGEF